MKTVSIINLKGGVAKTLTTVSMAYALSQQYNARVLVVDNDKQGNCSKTFGVHSYDRQSIADLMLDRDSYCLATIGIANLESTALQWSTVLIGFQHFQINFICCRLRIRTKRQLIAGQLNRRLNQNDRLNARTAGRCNIDIVAVNIHAG